MPEDILANKKIKNTKVAKKQREPRLSPGPGQQSSENESNEKSEWVGSKAGARQEYEDTGGTLFHIPFVLKVPRPSAPAATTEAPLNLLEVYILWTGALVL